MKKLLFFLPIAVLFLLVACKKEPVSVTRPDPNVNGEKYEVKFAVKNFNQSVTGISKLANTAPSTKASDSVDISNYIDHIYFRVYTMETDENFIERDFTFIDSANQDSNNPNFGTITKNLLPGDYKVYIVGSKGALQVSAEDEGTDGPYLNYADSDLFYTTFNLSITDHSVTYPVSLNRIIGQLEVNIEDAIPQDASKIEVIINDDASIFYLQSNWDAGSQISALAPKTITKVIQAADKGQTNLKINTFILNTKEQAGNWEYTPLSVLVRCHYSNSSLVTDKLVEDVLVFNNKKTILTGQLFPPPNSESSQFSVSIDPIWKDDLVVPF